MTKRHTRVTQREKRRKKKSSFAKKALICVAVVTAVALGANAYINNLYNHGDSVSEDIRTADDLKDDVINILVAGLDYEDDRTVMMSDVIMYVTLNVKDNTISAFQIPRDTYVGDDVKTGGTGKINGAYWYGDKKNKIENLIQVVHDKLGLSVDHYVTLDMQAFIAMVDGIDNGLQMYVPYPVYLLDEKTGRKEYIISEPGWYYVDGKTAEQIVRNRHYDGADIARLEVQGYFYAAIVKNFTETLSVSDFIKIMNRFTQYITTDLHWTEIASMAKFAFGVDYNDMVLVKPSLHGYNIIKVGKESYTNILTADQSSWIDLLNTYSRPYQTPLDASTFKLPTNPPAGEITHDFGVTASSVQSIGDILNKSPEQ